MSGDENGSNVAIACQGGGSHTAFTAGVLMRVFEAWDEGGCDERDIVGLSGTSGGAINAVAAWYGLETGGPERAIELLDAIWHDIAADTPLDRMSNRAAVWNRRVRANGFALPRMSPYQLPAATWAREQLASTIERYIDFEELRSLCGPDRPELVIGTVNINAGEFETFTNEDVTTKAVLASAAVPDLFEAVEIHDHYHWDGLFSQNPPIRDLMTGPVERRPDELWVVQINPQTRTGEPKTLEAIVDRRNELAGNISLNQEIGFVETVNEWLAAGHLPESQFSHTAIHRIELGRELRFSTKFDRREEFIEDLIALGRERASAFLADRAADTGDTARS